MSVTAAKLQEIRDKRNQFRAEGLQIVERAEAEKRDMTAEENGNWQRCCQDQAIAEAQYDRLVTEAETDAKYREQDARAANLSLPQPLLAGKPEAPQQEAEEAEYDGPRREDPRKMKAEFQAFNDWLRVGFFIDPRHRALMAPRQVQYSRLPADVQERIKAMSPELRSQLMSGADNLGGYTVPTLAMDPIEKARNAFGGIRRSRATVRRTLSGADLPMPTVNDVANKGRRLGEGQAAAKTQFQFGQKILHAYMYTSDIVPISLQLLADTADDITSLTADLLGERLGRIMNEEDTIGTGNSMPEGITVGAPVGVTSAAPTAVTFDEVAYSLIPSVNADYRQDDLAQFMFNDNTLFALKKLKNGQGAYLWQSGVAFKEPDKIDRFGYVINYDMPDIGASKIPIVFGDLSKFILRDVAEMTLFRFAERYMDELNIGFVAFMRHDAKLLNAGTGPVKSLQCHA